MSAPKTLADLVASAHEAYEECAAAESRARADRYDRHVLDFLHQRACDAWAKYATLRDAYTTLALAGWTEVEA